MKRDHALKYLQLELDRYRKFSVYFQHFYWGSGAAIPKILRQEAMDDIAALERAMRIIGKLGSDYAD